MTVATQRMSMVTALGELSENTVTGSSAQSLAAATAELYLPLLQAECKSERCRRLFKESTTTPDLKSSLKRAMAVIALATVF